MTLIKSNKNSPDLQVGGMVTWLRSEIFEKFVKCKVQIFQKSQAGNSRFYPNLKVGAIFPLFSTFNVNMY